MIGVRYWPGIPRETDMLRNPCAKFAWSTGFACLIVATTASLAPGFDESVLKIKAVDADRRLLYVYFNLQVRAIKVAADAKVLGADGKVLEGGLLAKDLTDGTVATLDVERVDGEPTIKSLRLGNHFIANKPSIGLTPLNEMSADDRYKGQDGGLYGAGKNEPPAAHLAAAHQEIAQIVPRDRDGRPSPDGKVVLISISMSNATMEFSTFKQIADADSEKSPVLTIVDCAQGGQAMGQWADPQAKPWTVALERLDKAGVSPEQVQVAWIKLANMAPQGDLEKHGRKLQAHTAAVLRNARARFQNLRVAYLDGRIYAGYTGSRLNPEPYAYESAFVVRWLIQDQMQGNKDLNYAAARGVVNAPLLLWGPYLWADGVTPRKSDGLVWKREDLAADGTHPSDSGRRKVAELLLKFFKTDGTAQSWFRRTQSP